MAEHYIDGVTYGGVDYSIYCSGGTVGNGDNLTIASSGSSGGGGYIVLAPGTVIGALTSTSGGSIRGVYQASGQSPIFPLILYLNIVDSVTSLHLGNSLYYPLILEGTDIKYRHIVNNNSVDETFTFKSDFTLNEDGTILTINLD